MFLFLSFINKVWWFILSKASSCQKPLTGPMSKRWHCYHNSHNDQYNSSQCKNSMRTTQSPLKAKLIVTVYQIWNWSDCSIPTYDVFTTDTLRYVVTVTCDLLTLNDYEEFIVTWSNRSPTSSILRRSLYQISALCRYVSERVWIPISGHVALTTPIRGQLRLWCVVCVYLNWSTVRYLSTLLCHRFKVGPWKLLSQQVPKVDFCGAAWHFVMILGGNQWRIMVFSLAIADVKASKHFLSCLSWPMFDDFSLNLARRGGMSQFYCKGHILTWIHFV